MVYTFFRDKKTTRHEINQINCNNDSFKVLFRTDLLWSKLQGKMFHCRDGGFEESSQEQLSPSHVHQTVTPCGNIHTSSRMYGWTIHNWSPACKTKSYVIDFEFRKHCIHTQCWAGVVKDMLTVTYKTCISDSMGKYGTSLYEKGIIFSISKTKEKGTKGREPKWFK